MYAIDERVKKVNGVEVETFRRFVEEGNAVLEAEAGTTGFKGGGCRAAGGRFFLCIGGVNGDFLFKPILDKEEKCVGIIIAGSGDDALNAILKATGFCLEALADQCAGANE